VKDTLEFDPLDRSKRGIRERHSSSNFSSPSSSYQTRFTDPNYQAALSSGASQCVFKVASFAKGARVKSLLSYITRSDKKEELEFTDHNGVKRKGGVGVEEVFNDWSSDFERKKRSPNSRNPRHASHIILSADTDNSEQSAAKVNFAARDFLDKFMFERGYRYVYVTHRDTENPHVHVVVHNKNQFTGKKLHISKSDAFELRKGWADALTKWGIESVATLRRDRPEVLRQASLAKEKVQLKESWNHRKMLAASNVPGLGLSLSHRGDMFQKLRAARRLVKDDSSLSIKDKQKARSLLRVVGEAVRNGSRDQVVAALEAGKPELSKMFGDSALKPLFSGLLEVDREVIKPNHRLFTRYLSANKYAAKQLLEASEKALGLGKRILTHSKGETVVEGLLKQQKSAKKLLASVEDTLEYRKLYNLRSKEAQLGLKSRKRNRSISKEL